MTFCRSINQAKDESEQENQDLFQSLSKVEEDAQAEEVLKYNPVLPVSTVFQGKGVLIVALS